MDDILSGGKIDSSTSGPTPPKVDDRNRDILLEQKERQDQDAIGGTQFPPRAQPPPPIPEALEIAPPLPIVVPTFDVGITGSALEETREIARQATVDILKNVTINGQGPSIEGSTISFNIPKEQPASEIFFFQGVAISQMAPETVTQPQPPIQDIQSVTVSPPQRQAQVVSTEAQTIELVEKPQASSVDINFDDAQVTRDRARTSGAEIDSSDAQIARDKARNSGAEIDFDDAQINRYNARISGAEIDFDDAQEARDKATSSDSSKRAYKVTEEEKEERLERNEKRAGFDRESSIRQAGETPREFRERQEQLRQEKTEKRDRERAIQRAREGDIQEVPSGFIPVAFRRADGQKRIFTLLASEFVGVVEGASGDDRSTTLPSDQNYYEAGGGSSCIGLQLYVRTEEDGTQELWISAGLIAGRLPSGFDPNNGAPLATGGAGYAYAYIYVTDEGIIEDRGVGYASEIQESNDYEYFYTLGYFEFNDDGIRITNYGCGSVDVVICRNWFASEAPFYGVTMGRCCVAESPSSV